MQNWLIFFDFWSHSVPSHILSIGVHLNLLSPSSFLPWTPCASVSFSHPCMLSSAVCWVFLPHTSLCWIPCAKDVRFSFMIAILLFKKHLLGTHLFSVASRKLVLLACPYPASLLILNQADLFLTLTYPLLYPHLPCPQPSFLSSFWPSWEIGCRAPLLPCSCRELLPVPGRTFAFLPSLNAAWTKTFSLCMLCSCVCFFFLPCACFT